MQTNKKTVTGNLGQNDKAGLARLYASRIASFDSRLRSEEEADLFFDLILGVVSGGMVAYLVAIIIF